MSYSVSPPDFFYLCRRTDDPLVRDCVRSYTQDWNVVNRKYVCSY